MNTRIVQCNSCKSKMLKSLLHTWLIHKFHQKSSPGPFFLQPFQGSSITTHMVIARMRDPSPRYCRVESFTGRAWRSGNETRTGPSGNSHRKPWQNITINHILTNLQPTSHNPSDGRLSTLLTYPR